MALDNPIEAFLRVAQAKNQNRRQAQQDAMGIGQNINQGFNTIGQQMQEQKKKQMWQKTVNSMMQNPNIDPKMRQFLPMIAQNPELASSLLPKMMPKATMGGPGKRVVYQNPDGSVSLTPTEGSTPLEVSDAQAMQYTAIPKSAKEKNAALGSRAEAMQRGIDVKQIDQLVSRTGLTPKMQSQLQMNTMRALRSYIPILSRPRITYQELALGEMDLAGIMHGGVPQRDEVINTHFPGWQEKLSQIKTYAMGHPQEIVPPDIQNKVKQMIGDVVKIDNGFLQANAKFSKTMLGPTIRGGLNPQQTGAINEMTSTLTPPLNEGQRKAGVTPYSDPQKEARYQAWKKSKGL